MVSASNTSVSSNLEIPLSIHVQTHSQESRRVGLQATTCNRPCRTPTEENQSTVKVSSDLRSAPKSQRRVSIAYWKILKRRRCANHILIFTRRAARKQTRISGKSEPKQLEKILGSNKVFLFFK